MGDKSKKVVKRDYTSNILSNVMFNFLGQSVILVASHIVNINIVIVSEKWY